MVSSNHLSWLLLGRSVELALCCHHLMLLITDFEHSSISSRSTWLQALQTTELFEPEQWGHTGISINLHSDGQRWEGKECFSLNYTEWICLSLRAGLGPSPKACHLHKPALPSPPEPQETWGCWWHSSAPPPAQNTYCEHFKYRRRGKGKEEEIKKRERDTQMWIEPMCRESWAAYQGGKVSG